MKEATQIEGYICKIERYLESPSNDVYSHRIVIDLTFEDIKKLHLGTVCITQITGE